MKYFWKNSSAVASRLTAAPRLLVALDFDGTLAALAEAPRMARLTPEFKAALRNLASAQGVSVFILSGRALKNVMNLVGLRKLYYGGNHGIEIKGPGFSWRDKKAVKACNLVSGIAVDMRERFPPGTGVLVENKVFSASIHYRNIEAAYKRGFFSRIRTLMSDMDGTLRWRKGHKVFELLPGGSAHKGFAVTRLAARLKRPLCVAVGDDLTDEDMFRALEKHGIAIRVGRKTETKARYFLAQQSEVIRLVRFIIAARSGEK